MYYSNYKLRDAESNITVIFFILIIISMASLVIGCAIYNINLALTSILIVVILLVLIMCTCLILGFIDDKLTVYKQNYNIKYIRKMEKEDNWKKRINNLLEDEKNGINRR